MADCNTWNEIEDYAIAHEAFFRKYLELPAGIPSHGTFNRVFAIMDFIVMEQNDQEWIRKFVAIKKESVISIDGKCIRGTGNKDEHGAAHMLSACLSEEGISPGQLNVDKKTNEITVFPQLLDTRQKPYHCTSYPQPLERGKYALDVVFGEDAGRKRRWNASENFSRLIKVVMSLLRNHKKKTGGSQSMARMRKQAACQ